MCVENIEEKKIEVRISVILDSLSHTIVISIDQYSM